MTRRYNTNGTAASGTNKTNITMVSAATIRPEIYDILLGAVATPADQAARFLAGRFTAAGTAGTSFTPVALEPADPASLAASGFAHSGEPTYTANANLLQISLNQRATFRWIAAPGSELRAPATAANGIGLYSLSSTSTQAYEGCLLFQE